MNDPLINPEIWQLNARAAITTPDISSRCVKIGQHLFAVDALRDGCDTRLQIQLHESRQLHATEALNWG